MDQGWIWDGSEGGPSSLYRLLGVPSSYSLHFRVRGPLRISASPSPSPPITCASGTTTGFPAASTSSTLPCKGSAGGQQHAVIPKKVQQHIQAGGNRARTLAFATGRSCTRNVQIKVARHAIGCLTLRSEGCVTLTSHLWPCRLAVCATRELHRRLRRAGIRRPALPR